MPVLSISEAVEKLIRAVEGMGADDLLDVHNEIFPKQPKSTLNDADGGASDRRKVISYIEQGLAIEEIIDLWNVAFPESYDVRYDDENGMICYSSEPEAIQLTD